MFQGTNSLENTFYRRECIKVNSWLSDWFFVSFIHLLFLKIIRSFVTSSFHCFILHLFLHSFIHSFILSFVCSFIHPFIHSFIHSFIHPFIHSFIIHPFIYAFIHSFSHPFIHHIIHRFIYAFIHNFIHPFPHHVIHSFIHSFIHPPSLLGSFLRPPIFFENCSVPESNLFYFCFASYIRKSETCYGQSRD